MSSLLPLYGAAALRQLETQACAALGGDAFELMRRAGEAAWRCVLQHWPQAQRLVVVCGPGNNGGDGYVLARHAKESGRDVHVFRLRSHAPRSELAQWACAEYLAAGGEILIFDECKLPPSDLIVDAIFGIGLDRAVEGEAADLLQAMNQYPAPLLALDVPSGVISDSGATPGTAIHATRTLQFMGNHAGLRTGSALDMVGVLETALLDIPAQLRTALELTALLADARHPPLLPSRRRRDSHKGSNGHVLCVGGEDGYGGAALLCSEASLRAGAGLVSLATRTATVQASLARRPECMAQAVDRGGALETLLWRADVIAIGPGLGQSDWARDSLQAALGADKPLVIDADALNLLANEPNLLRGQAQDVILTPHPGEAARLLGCGIVQVQADRFAAAQKLAENFTATVVLKGAGSIVAAPGRTPCVIGAGNPGMAVGGMGDVLTGTIAAMRAQGVKGFEAACAGAWLHAIAGDAVAQIQGEIGLLPSDLIAQLPLILHSQSRS